VAIDQPLFASARLDPVGGEEIEAFDVVDVVAVEELMAYSADLIAMQSPDSM
jgi:hypothetical protein